MDLWTPLGPGPLLLGLDGLAHRRQPTSQELLGNWLLLGSKTGHQGVPMGAGRVEALGPSPPTVAIAPSALASRYARAQPLVDRGTGAPVSRRALVSGGLRTL